MIRKLICLIVVISLSSWGLTSVLSDSDVNLNPFLADDLVPVTEVKIDSFSPDGRMKILISCETKPVTGGRLLAAVSDPEFEIVLLSRKSLSKKSFADESWTETVAGKVSVPANGKVEVSSDLLDLTVKARIEAGDKFFKIKIR